MAEATELPVVDVGMTEILALFVAAIARGDLDRASLWADIALRRNDREIRGADE